MFGEKMVGFCHKNLHLQTYLELNGKSKTEFRP